MIALRLHMNSITLTGVDSRLVRVVEKVLEANHANPSGMSVTESKTLEGASDVWFEVNPRLYLPNALTHVGDLLQAIYNGTEELQLGEARLELINQIGIEIVGTYDDGIAVSTDEPDIALCYSSNLGFTTKTLTKPQRYVINRITFEGFTSGHDRILGALSAATEHSLAELGPRVSVDTRERPAVARFHNTVKTENPGTLAQRLADMLADDLAEGVEHGIVTVEVETDVRTNAKKHTGIAYTDEKYQPTAAVLLVDGDAPFEAIADAVYTVVRERCRVLRTIYCEPYPASLPSLFYYKFVFNMADTMEPAALQALADALLAVVLEKNPVKGAPGHVTRLAAVYCYDYRKGEAGEMFDPNYMAYPVR